MDKIGQLSYHFYPAEKGGCYISYEDAPSEWILDNGNPLPKRKPFSNFQYDQQTRKLTADVYWHESSFGGDAHWKYDLQFSPDLQIISSGTVLTFDVHGKCHNQLSFGEGADDLRFKLYKPNVFDYQINE